MSNVGKRGPMFYALPKGWVFVVGRRFTRRTHLADVNTMRAACGTIPPAPSWVVVDVPRMGMRHVCVTCRRVALAYRRLAP